MGHGWDTDQTHVPEGYEGFDMHCDTLSALMYDRKNNIQSELRQNNHHLDLMKMMKGDYMLQCFAVYINKEYSDNVLLDGMKLVDTFYNEMEKIRT